MGKETTLAIASFQSVGQGREYDCNSEITGWCLPESGLGAGFPFDEIADDAGIEEVSH